MKRKKIKGLAGPSKISQIQVILSKIDDSILKFDKFVNIFYFERDVPTFQGANYSIGDKHMTTIKPEVIKYYEPIDLSKDPLAEVGKAIVRILTDRQKGLCGMLEMGKGLEGHKSFVVKNSGQTFGLVNRGFQYYVYLKIADFIMEDGFATEN